MKRISHYLSFVFLVALVISYTQVGEAQRRSSGGGGRSGGGPGLFSGGLMVALGQGKMGNGSTDAPDRAMIYTPVTLFAGINIKKFRIGGNYEYNIAGQSEDPNSVGGTNLSGKGGAMGVRLDYWDGKQAFGLIYRISDTFNLDKQTNAGTTAVYKSKGGFQVQYYRQIKKRFGFVIDYTTETFDESLTNKVKWDRISLGIVLTNFAVSGK